MRFFKTQESKPSQPETEVDELRQAFRQIDLPDQILRFATKELDRLERMGSATTEYTIGINHLEYILSLPWNRSTEDNLDIQRAESILDKEHFGLRDIKERILEHLAVRILHRSRGHSILVVDDETITCKNLEHVLQGEGYFVSTATNGPEALALIQKNTFDMVITDLKMEEVDGLNILQSAKEKNPTTEVIIITGYATVPVAVDAMQKGSFQFLSKPLQLEEIRKAVSQAISRKLSRLEPQGPVLCFIGPPGTGKTSLGQSIARSLERTFIRISLAGIKDESQLRGHRRSYVGALPGRIIQEIRRVETKNPLFMLDEIDKLGQEFKGDPAAALLEILDPEQNRNFMDHYLDVPFDLSKVMFIATANSTDLIPEPLLDRLETLHLAGYTEEEKERIAFEHLIPREVEQASLQGYPIAFTSEAVQRLIREYTREAGLRNLQRSLASICRKTARDILAGRAGKSRTITYDAVEDLLGSRKYYYEVAAAKDRVGVSTGLAWTPWGGEIMFIEATSMPGTGNLMLTGSLGEVLKESAQAALSYIRSNAAFFDIRDDFFKTHDLHIHVPAGAIPKDGPSAGLPIAMALISLVTGRACKRDVALSGELTLTGRILPVSGIREKLLAGRASGVKTIVFPAKNETEIKSIQQNVKKDLHILPVQEIKDILDDVLRPAQPKATSRIPKEAEPGDRDFTESCRAGQTGRASGMAVIKDLP